MNEKPVSIFDLILQILTQEQLIDNRTLLENYARQDKNDWLEIERCLDNFEKLKMNDLIIAQNALSAAHRHVYESQLVLDTLENVREELKK